jgi:hypothetical protein
MLRLCDDRGWYSNEYEADRESGYGYECADVS